MYFYLFDAFLRDKKYERTLARIESRLLDLGIQGKSEKLTILKSMKEVVENAVKRGADTIVAVGDDRTISKLISIIADRDIILGFIPIGEKRGIAEALGIPEGVKACDVLSARMVRRIDLGKANSSYFLSFLNVTPGRELLIECDGGKYFIETSSGSHAVSVYNIGAERGNPHDGVLEAEIRRAEAGSRWSRLTGSGDMGTSYFPVKSIRIKSLAASLPAYADGQTVVKTPITVKAVPRKLRVIVGKTRRFS